MSTTLARQAEQLYTVFSELVRQYQFRDREGICCHGLSVTQCYALDALERLGPLRVGDLASRLFLEISSMTRVVDFLVQEKLATRARDPRDRRVCLAKITTKGERLVGRIRTEITSDYERILSHIPRESRNAVIQAVTEMLHACQCCQTQDASVCCPGE